MPDQPQQATWSSNNPTRVIAGEGALDCLPTLVSEQAKVLLITTAGFTARGLTKRIQNMLGSRTVVVHDKITPNPELEVLDRATNSFRNEGIECIVALGGGSAIDAAKVLAVTIPCGISDPLVEMLRNGLDHEWKQHIPLIAIPTTSGTGAEVTPFATVWDKATQKKHSVVGESVCPTHAILDPELTVGLPADITLNTGLDTISHALESLWNKNRSSESSEFAMQALGLAITALPVIQKHPDNLQMRSKMQQASMLAGLAISQTRTALAHSISYPLTIHFGVPHGLACSFTLPAILRKYLSQLEQGGQEFLLLQDVLTFLEGLELKKKIASYASYVQIITLEGEMYTEGRADNFTVTSFDTVKELLIQSTDKISCDD